MFRVRRVRLDQEVPREIRAARVRKAISDIPDLRGHPVQWVWKAQEGKEAPKVKKATKGISDAGHTIQHNTRAQQKREGRVNGIGDPVATGYGNRKGGVGTVHRYSGGKNLSARQRNRRTGE